MVPFPSFFGLTGGIACGKSTVAQLFGRLGARIVDADHIAHELLRRPNPAYAEAIQTFGHSILNGEGEIDRKRLGRIIFADPKQRNRLNAILHPKIIARQEELAARYHEESPGAVILVEAALIYEAGVEGRFSKILVAWCRPEQQIERLMAKAGITPAEAEARITAQVPLEEKRRRADFLIDCSGTLETIRAQVAAIYPQLKQLAAP
ncbi:MAG TPA: dephospho-CoA kinase [Terriglobia bacterium]|nr:dephospho-CoA kinase [Terriglobia bacterium]